MASIRKFVEDFHALGKKLNVLVNNAGLFLKSDDQVRQFTKDNFELTMGTNHLGMPQTPDLWDESPLYYPDPEINYIGIPLTQGTDHLGVSTGFARKYQFWELVYYQW